MREITKDTYYIGVSDREIDLFEGQYIVPNGMAYNSYIVTDDKITVFDTVDRRFTDEWFKNIEEAIGDKAPDYLIVQHMEPDHSSSLAAFAEKYPDTVIVASAMAFAFMKQFYAVEPGDKKLAVTDGDELCTGKHTFHFVSAPMVHWPEVIMTYDSYSKAFFSADAFGKFGAFDADEEWACEARRYYFGIVGKYGAQVQALLKKAAGLDIKTICPLHGPVLSENLDYYLGLYGIWSSYGAESEGVFIAYTSVYGDTKQAVEILKEELEKLGCPKIASADLAREDMAEAVEDAFRYKNIVLATTTYNTGIFPFMETFLSALTERNFQNKKIGLIENGTWAPAAAKVMREKLAGCKNIEFTDMTVTIRSAVSEQNKLDITKLAKQINN
ncbi:MAG: FprA family A-type flavoprotein [Acutalibacteraceae bacterium]